MSAISVNRKPQTTKRILYGVALCAALSITVGCSEQEDRVDDKQSSPASETESASTPKASTTRTSALNDTGITWGGDYPKNINADCSAKVNHDELPEGDTATGDIHAQQDCASGRDATANNDEDGKAGFAFRKMNAQGELLEREAKSWDCVLDEISGLAWEVKKSSDGTYGNSGLHDADDLFTWYYGNGDANGGAVGDWNNRFDQCAGYQADQPATYCNTGEFVSRVNKSGLCGFSDWRVPTRPELESLVNFGRSVPAIEIAYFPNTQNEFYWSLSPTAGQSETAWAVSFQFGFSAPMPRSHPRPVRLVRNWAPEAE